MSIETLTTAAEAAGFAMAASEELLVEAKGTSRQPGDLEASWRNRAPNGENRPTAPAEASKPAPNPASSLSVWLAHWTSTPALLGRS